MEVIKILIQKIIIEIQSTTTNTLPCVHDLEIHSFPSFTLLFMILEGGFLGPSVIIILEGAEGLCASLTFTHGKVFVVVDCISIIIF